MIYGICVYEKCKWQSNMVDTMNKKCINMGIWTMNNIIMRICVYELYNESIMDITWMDMQYMMRRNNYKK